MHPKHQQQNEINTVSEYFQGQQDQQCRNYSSNNINEYQQQSQGQYEYRIITTVK